MTTIRNALTQASSQLNHRCDNAMLECEILLAYVLKKSRTYLLTWPERELTAAQHTDFSTLIRRRKKGEPSAYITGEREFWSLSLEVTPDTLIPRAETELLVELALEQIPADESLNVADLGTGSGAIALALASERPNSQIFAVDFSASALSVAERNRARHHIKNVTLREGSWLEAVSDVCFDVIISNPPYIQIDDPHLNRGDLPYEPRTALVADDNGLKDIHTIIENSRARLSQGGWLLIEHGFDQAKMVTQIFSQHGYHNITTHRDLSDQPRVVSGQYNR